MKNILVPLDFSKASGNAAKYAASLAKAFDAEVTFINATPPPMIVEDPVLASVMITQPELLENSKKLMEEETEAVSKNYSLRITGLVQEGFPADVIDEMSKEKHPDLIVMGMKGKGKTSSVFGSTTTTIISKSAFPVFVIPEEADYKPISNITFASDFDAKIEMDRFTLLLELGKKFNSQINILNVQKKNSSLKPDMVIGKMNTSLAFSKLNHKFYTINESNVEDGINKFIKRKSTDALAMVAHRHNIFERMFGKVHTRAMSYQTKIPLLVLPGK